MDYILLLIAITLFTYLAWRRILWGAAAVIILLPAYMWRFDFFGLPTTFLELMILTLFIVWLWKDKKYLRVNFFFSPQSKNLVPPFARWLLGAWLLVSVVAVIINPGWTSIGLWRAYFLEPMLFFLVLIYEVKDSRDLKIIFNSLAGLVLALFVVVVIQQLTSWNLPAAYDFPSQRRLTGLFPYPNALALLVAPISSLFAGLWLKSKKKRENWLYLVIFIVGLLLCLLAVSQGAVIAIVFSLFIWLILAKRIRRIVIPIVALAIITSLFFAPVKNLYADIRQQIFDPQLDLAATSLEIRSSQWSETWSMLSEKWFWGAGLAGYQDAVAPFHTVKWLEVYLYPHNIFLNFWSEMGLLGMLVLVIFMFYLFTRSISLARKNNFLGWPLILFWLTWFIHGLVDVPYFKNDLSILFFIGVAATILADKAIERNANI